MYCTVDKSLAKQILPELVNACFIWDGGGEEGLFVSVRVCVCVFLYEPLRGKAVIWLSSVHPFLTNDAHHHRNVLNQ